MKELKLPLLNKDQIEVRVGQVSPKGCTLLLYKTSRTDAEILDRVVGQGNWQKKFYTLQGVGIGDQVRSIVVCSVGIYDEDKKEWIWKDDSGTESQVEQDKGICSDAFKRAAGGSCWGIGRELYYTGFIFAKVPTQQKLDNNGRPKGYELVDKYMSFEVKEIKWNENPLSLKSLVIVDNNANVVFSYGSTDKVSQTTEKAPKKGSVEEITSGVADEFGVVEEKVSGDDLTFLQAYVGNLKGDEYPQFFNWLERKYGVKNIAQLSKENGRKLAYYLKNRDK